MSQGPEAADDELGSLSSLVGRSDPAPADTDGISLAYDAPATITGVRLTCLGEGTLEFTVHMDGTGSGSSRTVTDVPGGPDAHEESLSVTEVTEVRVTATGADRDGAWRAVVLGHEQG
ncbi:hypothetical protein GCM10009718_33760 [Isoptericola halotolerans]